MPLTPAEAQELSQLQGQVKTGPASLNDPSLNKAYQDVSNPQVRDMLQWQDKTGGQATKDAFNMVSGSAVGGSSQLTKLLTGGSALRNIGASAGLGAMQGGLSPAEDMDHRLSNAKRGALIGGAVGTLAQGVSGIGSLLRKPVDTVAGRAAGFDPAEATAYQSNPQGVEDLAQQKELGQQAYAEAALGKARQALGDRAGTYEDALQKELKDVSIPRSKLEQAGKFTPDRPQEFINEQLEQAGFGNSYKDIPYDKLPQHAKAAIGDYNVPGSAIQSAQRNAYDQRYIKNPITGIPEPSQEGASEAADFLRSKIREANPNTATPVDRLREGIEAQQNIKNGSGNPISFMGKNADTAAARQDVDRLVGTGLDKTARELQAAQAINSVGHKGFMDRAVLAPAGRVGLRVTQALSNATPDASTKLQQLGIGLGSAATSQSGLSPEEEAELKALKSQVR